MDYNILYGQCNGVFNPANSGECKELSEKSLDYYEKQTYYSYIQAFLKNYYGNRAQVREKKNDISGALADSDKAIALAPKNHHNYYDRGNIRLHSKDYAGAILDFNKTLALKPDYFAVRKSRAEAYRGLGKSKLADADEKIFEAESQKFFDKLKL